MKNARLLAVLLALVAIFASLASGASAEALALQEDWIYRDGLLLATVEPTGTKYFHLDHLGTPRRITNSSRAVIASHDYYPFGEEITASSQDSEALKFTGHERDLRDPTKTTDDLDYMHARFYNPWIGRFLSTDPVGGTPETPQSWNRYSYVGNSPLSYLDPDGREVVSATATATGAWLWGSGTAGGAAAAGSGVAAATGLGAVLVVGTVAVVNVGSGDGQTTVGEWWVNQLHTLFSKGGRQNVRDSGLEGITDEEIEAELKTHARRKSGGGCCRRSRRLEDCETSKSETVLLDRSFRLTQTERGRRPTRHHPSGRTPTIRLQGPDSAAPMEAATRRVPDE